MIDKNLIGSESFGSSVVPNPCFMAVAIGRRLRLALESNSDKEQEGHLEVVQKLLQKMDPVERRNVQQILDSLGGKFWAHTKPISPPPHFPAIKITCDRYGDMTAITCRIPGPEEPNGKTIHMELYKPDSTLPEDCHLFRMATGEPIIIRFSPDTNCKTIHEILAPFGCPISLGSG